MQKPIISSCLSEYLQVNLEYFSAMQRSRWMRNYAEIQFKPFHFFFIFTHVQSFNFYQPNKNMNSFGKALTTTKVAFKFQVSPLLIKKHFTQ